MRLRREGDGPTAPGGAAVAGPGAAPVGEGGARPAPRGPVGLVLEGPFAAVFWGKMSSAVATWMHALVAVVVVYDVSGSATVVSLVSAAQFAPQIVLAPLAGAWCDRGRMDRLILLGHVMCVVGAGGLGLVLLADPGAGPTVVAVSALTLLCGMGLAIAGPPFAAIVPSVIRPGELSVAMPLSTFPNTFGRLAGPAAGALAIAVLPHPASFGVCAAMYGVTVVAMLVPSFPQAAVAAGAVAGSSLRAGMRYVAGHRGLRLMMLATLTLAFASEPSITLAPALSEELAGNDDLVGWLSSGFGLGALAGSAAAMAAPRRVSVRARATTGLVLLASGMGTVGVVHAGAWAVGCFVVAGVGFALAIAGFSTLVQAHAAPEFRGRVTGLWLIAFVGARPLAALLVGLAADHAGTEVAFAGAGLVVLAAVWGTRPSALGPRARPM
ncbi:MFS transporter [Nocardioides caldifontis]|uniref:MFS transporter n=1 Tax=Nocardioides caldifontis TaxID=2588938 RepID=UPI0011DFC09B|nr:MFS transporter [Nocardioides caldifontis]